MADKLKEAIENMSSIMDGAIQLVLIYDPKGKDQKLFFVSCERLNVQEPKKE